MVSPRAYNRKVGLALLCPLTTRVKGYPFEVRLPPDIQADGAILADQVKSLDWRARKARRLGVVPRDVLEDVLAKLHTILFAE